MCNRSYTIDRAGCDGSTPWKAPCQSPRRSRGPAFTPKAKARSPPRQGAGLSSDGARWVGSTPRARRSRRVPLRVTALRPTVQAYAPILPRRPAERPPTARAPRGALSAPTERRDAPGSQRGPKAPRSNPAPLPSLRDAGAIRGLEVARAECRPVSSKIRQRCNMPDRFGAFGATFPIWTPGVSAGVWGCLPCNYW